MLWLPIENYLDNYDGRGSTFKILTMPNVYAAVVLVVVTVFISHPILVHVFKLKKLLEPLPKYQEIPNKDNDELMESDEELPLSTYTPLLLQKHTGFAFSGEPGQTPQITDPKFNRA